MKFNLIFAVIGIAISGCQSSNLNKNNQQDTMVAIGGDKDKHGCLIAAGYTWSTLQQDCIRIWEGSIPLEIINNAQSYQTAAYVFIDSVEQKAEVFVPDEKSSLILDKNGEIYTNGKFNLAQENSYWTLSLNQTKLYQERK